MWIDGKYFSVARKRSLGALLNAGITKYAGSATETPIDLPRFTFEIYSMNTTLCDGHFCGIHEGLSIKRGM
jgi:hypothetical protein